VLPFSLQMIKASWVSRESLIRTCIDVVDQSVSERNRAIQELSGESSGCSKPDQVDGTSPAPSDHPTSRPSTSQKKRAELEAEVYTAELKRRMIHDELAGESSYEHVLSNQINSYLLRSILLLLSRIGHPQTSPPEIQDPLFPVHLSCPRYLPPSPPGSAPSTAIRLPCNRYLQYSFFRFFFKTSYL
jgi:hypothetical protein